MSDSEDMSLPAAPSSPVLPPELPPMQGRPLHLHEMLLRPSTQNAVVMQLWNVYGADSDISRVTQGLHEMSAAAADGNMRVVEAALFDQAMALQAIFSKLAANAAQSKSVNQMEQVLRMAMRAQNQSRMTFETLATIKNPPTVFAKQANINNGGQQQINNGTAPVENSATRPNKLLEKDDGERLDFGTQAAAGGANPLMEAVGGVYRPSNAGGQGQGSHERLEGRNSASASRHGESAPRASGLAGRAVNGEADDAR